VERAGMSSTSQNPFESSQVTETPPPQPVDLDSVALRDHPKGFWFIFWGEFAERSSYYGMRAILAKYMADQLALGQDNAGTYMSYFIAACYFLPLAGGYVADRFFGKYWTIVGFSVPYIVGHFILGMENTTALAVALALLAMGSGVIKPNISSLMGMTYDQQRPGRERLRSNAFAIFYLAINIGAAVSSFAMPPIRDRYGYAMAFLFPTVLMVGALGAFAAGKRFYALETPGEAPNTPVADATDWRVMWRLMGLFALVAFFWAIFDQSTTTWIFFGDGCMDKRMLGMTISAEQMQFFNPVLIMVLLPLVTLLWNRLAERGIRIRATHKMIVGFLLTAVSMGIMSYAGYRAGPTEVVKVVKNNKEVEERVPVPEERRVSLNWQALAYLSITLAEILISVTGLELAFVAAPKSMKSQVTALWLLTVGIANLFINAPVTRLYTKLQTGEYFGMLAIAMLVVTVAFVFVGRRFNAAMDADRAGAAV
jgi:POT family proton-dependent oligopeptide transporter